MTKIHPDFPQWQLMPMYQLLASWQLTQRRKSFPGHTNSKKDQRNRELLGKWSALKSVEHAAILKQVSYRKLYKRVT